MRQGEWTLGVGKLRDAGCTTVVIRRELVADEQHTGEYKYYHMLDGSIGRVEVALVNTESPVFTGKVEGLCIVPYMRFSNWECSRS